MPRPRGGRGRLAGRAAGHGAPIPIPALVVLPLRACRPCDAPERGWRRRGRPPALQPSLASSRCNRKQCPRSRPENQRAITEIVRGVIYLFTVYSFITVPTDDARSVELGDPGLSSVKLSKWRVFGSSHGPADTASAGGTDRARTRRAGVLGTPCSVYSPELPRPFKDFASLHVQHVPHGHVADHVDFGRRRHDDRHDHEVP